MELIIVVLLLVLVTLIVMLHQVLRSKDDIDLTVNVKKGEMSVKKKKSP